MLTLLAVVALLKLWAVVRLIQAFKRRKIVKEMTCVTPESGVYIMNFRTGKLRRTA